MNKKSEKTLKNNRAANTQVNKTLILGLLTIALLIGSVAYILAADFASVGVFDINGQICADASGIPDWGQCATTTGTNGIFDATAPSTGLPIASHLPPGTIPGTAFFFNDGLKSNDLTMYPGSNKNNQPLSAADCLARGLTGSACAPWAWTSFSSAIQAKNDLSRVYTIGINATQNYPGTLIAKGDELLFIGLERISPSGDAHIDVEIFQSGVGLAQTPPCTLANPYCQFTGRRTTGDIIITMDFVVGGSLGSVGLRQFNAAINAYGPIVGGFNTTRTSGLICNGAAGTLCAENNPGPSDPAGPWGYLDSHGNIQSTVPTNGFTEIGVDITAITGTRPCIATILPKTRSSQSFTATLSDFAGPHQTGACTGHISIAPNKTNEVGTPHTFTVTVTKEINGATTPAAGVVPTVTLTPYNGISASNLTVLTNNCPSGTNSAGQCSITFVSNTAGKVNGSATATFNVLDTPVTVTTNGTLGNSFPAVKTYVDAFITVSPLKATNEVNTTHTFTFTVKQNDGSGSGYVVVSGATVSWTLTPTNGAVLTTASSGTCTTNGAGQCTVTFGSSQAGTVTVHGSVTLNVGGVSLTRATGDGLSFDSPDATKVFVDAFITVSPLTATNEVNTTHTFTFTVEANAGTGGGYVAVNGATVSWTLTPSNGAVLTTASSGTCTTNGAGQCTVTFGSTQAGTVTVHGSVSLVVSGVTLNRATGDGISFDSPDATKVFVDAFITVSPLTATNEVNTTHTFTFTVKQNDGSGSGYVVVNAATVSWTLTPTNGAVLTTASSGSCTTNGAGQCSVTFGSTQAGTVTVHGSVTLTVGGVSLTRMTGDGISFDSPDAVKVFVDAFITVTPQIAFNEVNSTHTFTFTVEENLGTGGGYVVVSGATVSWTLTPINGATLTSPSTGTCFTNGAGQCTVTFTSSSAGTVLVHGSVNLTVSTVPLTRATGDGISFDSPDAVKVFVDAFITVTPQQATNSVGQSHTFTFTVMVNIGDGSGYQPASGVVVSWTLTGFGGAVPSPSGPGTCTTNGAGQCTVTFSSATAGTVTVHGSISFVVSGVTLNRATGDGISFDSPDAVKIFIAGFISWIKEDNAGNLLAGATFQLCQVATFDPGTSTFTAITPVCQSVLDNNAPDTNPTGGIFNVTGLGLGNYTIVELSPPPGFSLPNPNPTVTVSLVSGSPSATITTPFTNPRPILKLTNPSYVNTLTSTPSQCPPTCTVDGTVVYTFTIHNFGTSTGYMNFTFTVTFLGGGIFSCVGGTTLSMNNVAVTAGGDVTFTKSCTYTSATAGSTVTADLTATYNTGSGDPLIRIVNGTPYESKFTIQTN